MPDTHVTILIVDDKSPGRYFKAKVLQRQGYEVVEAVNGQQALSLSAAVQPHVVVLDIVLPDISGVEVARQLKSNPATKDIMVLQTSAIRVNMEDRVTGIECGADAYLIEPLQEKEFVGTVRALSRLAEQLRENRRLLEKLMRTEKQLLDATEAAHCGVWDWNIQTGELEWFGTHERLAGVSIGSFSGKIQSFTDVLHPDDRPRVWQHLQELMVRGEVEYADEYRFLHSNGNIRWMQGTGRFHYDKDGRPLRMTGVVQDITAHKAHEDRLAEKSRLLDLVTDAIFVRDGVDHLLYWNQAAQELYGWTEEEALGKNVHELLKTQFPRPFADIRAEFEGHGRWNGELVRTGKDGRQMSIHSRWVVQRDGIGKPIAILETNTDITERRKIDRERQTFISLVENSGDFIGMCDLEGKPFYVNKAGLQCVGLDSLSAACAVKVRDYFFPEDQDFIENTFLPRVRREGYAEVEIRFRHFKTSEAVWMLYHVSTVADPDGHKIGFATVSRNISGRKEMERALRCERERLTLALEAGRMGVFDLNLVNEAFWWSPQVYSLFGVDQAHIKPTRDTFIAFLLSPDRERFWQQFQAALTNHHDFTCEFRIVRADRTLRWLGTGGHTEYDQDGRPLRHFGVIHDITERKLADITLRESEQRLELALHAGKGGVWDWDLVSDIATVSSSYRELYGHTPDEEVTYDTWLAHVHIEDRERMARYGEEFFLTGSDWRAEYRIVHPEKGERWMSAVGRLERDPSGRPLRFIGVTVDVTDRKRSEEVLRTSQSELARELADIRLLQDISTELIHEELIDGLYGKIVEAATAIMRSDFATIQRFYPGRGAKGELRILAHRGFDPHMVAREFEWVPADAPTTCAAALRTNQRVIVSDFEQCHFMAGKAALAAHLQIGIRAAQSTPLMSRAGRLVGMITTHWSKPHEPSERDLRLFDVLARQASDLIERSQNEATLRESEEQLRISAEQLERLVDERTRELLNSQERLRDLSTQLTLTEHHERKRLAEELHDHLQQLLVLGKLKIGQGKRFAQSIPTCAKVMYETDEVLTEALRYTRTLVSELSPPVVRDQGLVAGLQWLSEYMVKHEVAVALAVADDIDLNLSQDQTVLLFQSVRELLINCSKYAGTHEAKVTLDQRDGYVTITVEDQGVGFDPAVAEGANQNAGLSSRFGLFSVRERMKALGGTFDIQSSPGKGTKVTLLLPRGC